MGFKNKEAVSPVIGVILMVAITVLLAAVVYIWVSGFIGGGKSTPTVSTALMSGVGDKYVVKIASTSTSESVKGFDLTIQRGGVPILTLDLDSIYSNKVNGTIFYDNDANGRLNGGDTLVLCKGSGTDEYREGDELVLTYTPTGSRAGGIGLVG